jgi:tRNA-dihydrouridine synthase C
MEGLLDATLRDVLTRVGGVERCVAEFIRITDTLLPERVVARTVPELAQGWRTPAGVLVRPQLLGSDPGCLADNAARLAELGAPGVDLNFGCPAKTVNRHGGGAALLQEPEQLYRIVAAVRQRVPVEFAVSAKMRLGFADDRDAEVCAQALEAGGASELVVHARTRAQGYRPPAHWARVADVAQAVRIPVVANGEIWSIADAQACRQASGCQALMLGRGMVASPGLALAILGQPGGTLAWPDVVQLMLYFWKLVTQRLSRPKQAGRLKQWLFLLQRQYPEAALAFEQVRLLHDPTQVAAWLQTLHPGLAAAASAPQPGPG